MADYWKRVRRRAFAKALKDAGLDTGAGRMKVIGGAIIAGGGVILLIGGNADVWLKAIVGVTTPMALALLFFVWECLQQPALMEAEARAALADALAAKDGAENRYRAVIAAPKPVDLVRARGLLTRLSTMASRARRKQGGASDDRSAFADYAERDLSALLGIEAADAFITKHASVNALANSVSANDACFS